MVDVYVNKVYLIFKFFFINQNFYFIKKAITLKQYLNHVNLVVKMNILLIKLIEFVFKTYSM